MVVRGYLPWIGKGVSTLKGEGVASLDVGREYLPRMGEGYLPWMGEAVPTLHGGGVPTLDGERWYLPWMG